MRTEVSTGPDSCSYVVRVYTEPVVCRFSIVVSRGPQTHPKAIRADMLVVAQVEQDLRATTRSERKSGLLQKALIYEAAQIIIDLS